MTDDDKNAWSARLFDQLIEAGVRLFAYVPDAGNARLIELAEAHNEARPVQLASEQEGMSQSDSVVMAAILTQSPSFQPAVAIGR